MNWNDLRLRLRALLFRQRMEDELDEELEFHLAMETRKNLASGIGAEQAQRNVRAAFGGVTQVKEECRDMRGLRFVESLAQDVRYALSGFRRTPGFALTVVATIALGLGINAALFTVFNTYVLQPVQVRDPYGLYQFTWANPRGQEHEFSWPEFQELAKRNPAFSEVSAYLRVSPTRAEGHLMLGQLVTGNYFTMLGVSAVRGRTLLPEDAAAPGSAPIAVISSQAWTHKFGGDPNIIGKRIAIHGQTLEIVGVAEPGFRGVGEVTLDFWAPLTLAGELQEGESLFGAKQPERLTVIGRLRDQVHLARAQAALTAWMLLETRDRANAETGSRVILRSKATMIPLDPMLMAATAPVMMAFALVLVVACANVASMMLARAVARQREMGIRLAMGAGRRRLIRQLLTESTLLALLGAGAGFVVSQESIRWGQWLLFTTMPAGAREFLTLIPAIHPDWRVLGFMFAAAVASALVFGLAPAMQATRASVVQATKGETDFRPARLRSALVIAQVTASVTLLICAAVLLRANHRLQRLDTGLDTKGVIELRIQDRFRAKTLQELAGEPAVEVVAAASKMPFFGSLPRVMVATERAEQYLAGYLYASPEYFPVFRIPLARGRNFTQEEAGGGAAVAIVSQSTAARLWPGQEAVGQALRIEPDPRRLASLADPRGGPPKRSRVLIIGVVRDALNGWVGDPADETCVYLPSTWQRAGSVLLARVRGDQDAIIRKIDSKLTTSAPGAIDDIGPIQEIRDSQLYPFRAFYWTSAAVGGLALLLTLSGIYGVLSYVVTQRTREIGIRMALGAKPGAVAGLFLKQSLRFASMGAAIGFVGALGIVRVMASQIGELLFGSFDWVAFGMGLGLVVLASAAAAWLPSRRAAQIEPASTLRCD